MNDCNRKTTLILSLSTLAAGTLVTTASAVAQSAVPVGQMSRYCAGEASAALSVNPQYISTEGATRSGGQYVVRGRASRGRDSSTFECIFSGNGFFDRVVVTGGTAGNSNQSAQQDIPNQARSACLRRFGGGSSSRVSKVSALRPGYWEVMMDNNASGRSVACTVNASGDINQWVELGAGSSSNSSNRYPDQGRPSENGPFSYREAEELAAVWGTIRQAGRFEDINWRSVGLGGAPGSSEARRLMSTQWGKLRQARRFEDINWESLPGYRGSSGSYPDDRRGPNPFTYGEAEDLSAVWGRIRQAGRFEDINWRSVGLSGPPGSYEARSLMSKHWGRLRQANRFEDINWDSIR